MDEVGRCGRRLSDRVGDAAFQRLRCGPLAQALAEHDATAARQHRHRVGDSLARDLGRRAVRGPEDAGAVVGHAAGGRPCARFLCAKAAMLRQRLGEELLRGDDVEAAGDPRPGSEDSAPPGTCSTIRRRALGGGLGTAPNHSGVVPTEVDPRATRAGEAEAPLECADALASSTRAD
jgi:hypothetical protein